MGFFENFENKAHMPTQVCKYIKRKSEKKSLVVTTQLLIKACTQAHT
jgi:hypothetical protein